MEDLEDEYAIGLDLGTTFSCIGVYRNGGVEIIPNSNGDKITPSIVIITNDPNKKDELKILVGEETTDFLVQNYDSCIYEIKRLIGRDFSDEKLKEEIKKLPFKIGKQIKSKDGKQFEVPEVEININGKKKNFSPVEISSFIIKKMIKNAENYLGKRIRKIVITVPAYFNNSQRELTKQAAEAIGLKVIRVINEPTAAALCYGFELEQNINQKILVFDLGGGTFDVSILDLSITEEKDKNVKYKSFKVLATSGDTQLGGEDFDNELVKYLLDNAKKIDKEIKPDQQAIKRLKIACENAKKILSDHKETIIHVNNFYKQKFDLLSKITRDKFNEICKPHFDKLKLSLDEALSEAGLEKKDLNKIILIGGSTRIPKVREIITSYFPGCDIYKEINPDEAVAYGATIDAEKILHNKDNNISNVHFLDITPLSLGTDIINNSQDPEIQKEGNMMSVIIKRGTPVPTFGEKTYFNAYNNQTTIGIDIYEGEKKYVKYNHLLKKSNIKGLTERPKGKTKVIVKFEIDINGILNVKAKEQSEKNDGKTLELTIKNDEISLSEEEIETLKKINGPLINKIGKEIDFSNLKDTLKEYKNDYESSKDEEEKMMIIINYNNILEEFIQKFDKKYDNETILEKYYLYVKELFNSYIKTLKFPIPRGDKNTIFNNISKFIEIFIDNMSGYLKNLLDILEALKDMSIEFKMYFYSLIISIMKKLNDHGKTTIYSNEKFCKHHSLLYFEQCESLYDKYLSNVRRTTLRPVELFNSLEKELKTCKEYISDIKSGAIFICEASFNGGKLYGEEMIKKIKEASNQRGLTNDILRLLFIKGNLDNVIANFERALNAIKAMDKNYSKKEAICIANIIKLYKISGLLGNKINYLMKLADDCEFIIENIKIEKDEEWYKEFVELYNELKKINQDKEKNYQEKLKIMKETHGKEFTTIEEKFEECKNNKKYINFINFILEKHPYNNYNQNDNDFTKINYELLDTLLLKYLPDDYTPKNGDNNSELNFYIIHEIYKKLSNLFMLFKSTKK